MRSDEELGSRDSIRLLIPPARSTPGMASIFSIKAVKNARDSAPVG
jgi:hypothetical protein